MIFDSPIAILQRFEHHSRAAQIFPVGGFGNLSNLHMPLIGTERPLKPIISALASNSDNSRDKRSGSNTHT